MIGPPYVCPVCRGEGRTTTHPDSTVPLYETCRACHGACVLWPPYMQRPTPLTELPSKPDYGGTTSNPPPQTTWATSEAGP